LFKVDEKGRRKSQMATFFNKNFRRYPIGKKRENKICEVPKRQRIIGMERMSLLFTKLSLENFTEFFKDQNS
jgi:hypothetical protein